MLARWDFSVDLAKIPLLAEGWFHDSGAQLAVSDIVLLSKLHSYLGPARMTELPAINSMPAFAKLSDGHLSPEHSLEVLNEAKDMISQTLKLFDI